MKNAFGLKIYEIKEVLKDKKVKGGYRLDASFCIKIFGNIFK